MNYNFLDYDYFKISDTEKVSFDEKSSSEILIVVNQENFEEPHNEFLSKILKAISIDLNLCHFTIVQTNANLSLADCIKTTGAKKVLSFGNNPRDIQLNIADNTNQLLKFENFQLIVSPPLGDIKQDQNLKKSLWAKLQSWQPKKSDQV